jgi:nucleotide-binding universal stress UspA family protein
MVEAFEKQIHRILIAIDESENSLRAVLYVAELLQGMKDCTVLLLHIINDPEEDFFASETERQNWVAEKRQAAEDILQGCKDRLVRQGFDPKRVFTAVKVRNCPSIGECILNEAQSSQAGTVVVGRKGVSRKEEFLFGSVSNRIIHNAKDCTVWVVQ